MPDADREEFDAVIAHIKAYAAEHEKQMAAQCGMTVEEITSGIHFTSRRASCLFPISPGPEALSASLVAAVS